MNFVHIADMHFDTSFSQINDSKLGSKRRADQRIIFKKIIDFIKENEIEYLFIAGDFYEHKFINESTITYINNLFKEIPNTKIFITPGNHDPLLKNSFYSKYQWNSNVHIFSSKISMVEDENVRIYGYGFDDFYYTNPEIESFRLENKQKTNILITHATLDGTNNTERQYNAISKSKLQEIGFDYVALGHIHKSNYTEKEHIGYPGSTISMGFDEPGNHGMVVGKIENHEVLTSFIPLDNTEFKALEVDISNIPTAEELTQQLNLLELSDENFYEVYLTGFRNFEIDIYALKKCIFRNNIIKIKDKTKINYNLEEMSKEMNLKGLFVREIMDRLQNEEYDKETVEKALEIGLDILGK